MGKASKQNSFSRTEVIERQSIFESNEPEGSLEAVKLNVPNRMNKHRFAETCSSQHMTY